jgi:hypothetical protein
MQTTSNATSLTRFFTADKTIQSRAANTLGSQMVRAMLARMMYHARRVPVPASVQEDVKVLERDGLLVLPNFFPQAAFQDLRQRATELCEQERERVRQVVTGCATLHVLRGNESPIATALPEFFQNPRLSAILEAAERRPGSFARSYQAIERLVQGASDEHDRETDLHSDIFYTMHKAWLYLTDVTIDSPPLVYVKGSHLMSPAALAAIYRESCTSNVGSRRVDSEEFARRQMKETTMTCPANTLVIANTCGYHRRLRGKPGEQRFALHVAMRDANPFRWSM